MIETRLKELGLTVPRLAAPVANYAPSVVSGDWIYVSGQLPMVDGKLTYTGKLGRELRLEQGYEAAKICALNCLGALRQALGSLDRVERIVKISGFVKADVR